MREGRALEALEWAWEEEIDVGDGDEELEDAEEKEC